METKRETRKCKNCQFVMKQEGKNQQGQEVTSYFCHLEPPRFIKFNEDNKGWVVPQVAADSFCSHHKEERRTA